MTEISPFTFKDRVEAAAKAGWDSIGLIHSDIYATADKIGFPEMRRILEANGMKHVEFVRTTRRFGSSRIGRDA